jgi:mannose-6-phosphate isomerase-like protein (cupin superfamily)
VTGVNAAGRSHVVSIDPIDDGGFTQIWAIDPQQIGKWIAAIDPQQAAVSIEPAAGASRCVVTTFPPESKASTRPPAPRIHGLDEHGFHTTRTVDYDLVMQGRLVLILDEGSVELQQGDLVIQQATRHAWRNPGPGPAKLLAVLTTLP